MTYNEIINKVLAAGFDDAEIYASNKSNSTISLEDGKLSNVDSKSLFSLTLKAVKDGKMVTVSTESTDEKDIDDAIVHLNAMAAVLDGTEKGVIYDGKGTYTKVVNEESDSKNYSTQEKIALLEEMQKKTLAMDERIKRVPECEFSESVTKIEIKNSKGVELKKDYSYCQAVVVAFGEENGETTQAYEYSVKTKFKELEIDKCVKKVTEDVVNSLNPQKVETGEYPVVFSDDVASSILRAFSSMFSGLSALRKLTMLTGKENTKVFGDNITITDDPFTDKALFKESFDDEAVPCKKKDVVKNGVFVGFLHSLNTAAAFNTESTGNGFLQRGTVVPQPINMYLTPGEYSKEDLFTSTPLGVYVTEVNGLHAGLNTVSGDFHLQSSGRMIRDGKLAEPVTLFVIAGNFFDMMNNVEMIGNDLKDDFSNVASPSFKVKKLMISGK